MNVGNWWADEEDPTGCECCCCTGECDEIPYDETLREY